MHAASISVAIVSLVVVLLGTLFYKSGETLSKKYVASRERPARQLWNSLCSVLLGSVLWVVGSVLAVVAGGLWLLGF